MSEAASSKIRALVITISDGVHQGTRVDLSGPAVAARLAESGFDLVPVEVIPDERELITGRLREVAQSHFADVVFTTGGTGIAPRDVTPEAVRDVIGRELPGFGELMRHSGLQFTPLASLSRGLAGVAGTTLIVTLPGSPKGALESLGAILELVPHVHDLIHGRTVHAAPRGDGSK